MSAGPQPGAFFPAGRPHLPAGAVGRALFLDRDGVINVNHGYVHTPDQTDWVPGIFELCTAARDAGFALIVVTNQAGIARGYYDEEQLLAYTRWVHQQFAARGVPLLATYYCPHHPQGTVAAYRRECDCRKPRPGMILAAVSDFALNPAECLLVGDMPSDLQAADAAGLGGSWLLETLPADPRALFASQPG